MPGMPDEKKAGGRASRPALECNKCKTIKRPDAPSPNDARADNITPPECRMDGGRGCPEYRKCRTIKTRAMEAAAKAKARSPGTAGADDAPGRPWSPRCAIFAGPSIRRGDSASSPRHGHARPI